MDYILKFLTLYIGTFFILSPFKREGWGEGGKIVKSQQIKYFNVLRTRLLCLFFLKFI